jgi:hypothetical protein
LEWAAIVVGAIGGWASVSWAMGKVKELNSRPSPFDAAQAGNAEDDANDRPVPPEPRSRTDTQ